MDSQNNSGESPQLDAKANNNNPLSSTARTDATNWTRPKSRHGKAVDEGLNQKISELDQGMADLVGRNQFTDADEAYNKINELKSQLGKSSKKEFLEKCEQEKELLQEEKVQAFEEFNVFWDRKIAGFKAANEQIEEEMLEAHKVEAEELIVSLDQSMPSRKKDTPEILSLKKILQGLTKNKQFSEARQVSNKIAQLEKEQLSEWAPLREAKILNYLDQLKNKHTIELEGHRIRYNNQLAILEETRVKDYDRLIHRFKALLHHLETQHQIESYKYSPSNPSTAPDEVKKFNSTGMSFVSTKEYGNLCIKSGGMKIKDKLLYSVN